VLCEVEEEEEDGQELLREFVEEEKLESEPLTIKQGDL